ncbi:YesL family protein [Planctomonas psychrotolerans]|uniref:YesL family protein n=1 Tax=Planctomonas psychrotolerans TaxID=2528712 RepID=UPI00123A62D4|nr:DUF624 domain-containing protein [Planctomonas psychrotolerans]
MNDSEGGWAGRLMLWLRFAMSLVVLNLLFIAGTLVGFVLLGAFPAAVATTTLLARLRAGDPIDSIPREFVALYRGQFWHLNRVAVPFWLAGALLALDAGAFAILAADPATASSPMRAVLGGLFLAAAVVTVLAAASAVTVCSRYRDTVRGTWRYALVLPLVSPAMSAALLVCLAATAIALMAFGVLVPLVGASLPLLLAGWIVDYRLAALDPTHPSRPTTDATAPARASARPATSAA